MGFKERRNAAIEKIVDVRIFLVSAFELEGYQSMVESIICTMPKTRLMRRQMIVVQLEKKLC